MNQTHAVVIGGSIAGLSAAAALATRFETVTVLERDIIPDTAAGRRGVPQSWHNHFLLQRGRESLELLFPGFGEQIIADGGLALDPAFDGAQCLVSGWYPRSQSDVRMVFASRPRFESTIRALALNSPRIEYIQGATVSGLLSVDGRVTGVSYLDPEHGVTELSAGLVVDAGGRGSRATTWLKQIGVDPEEHTLDARVRYASRWYRWPDETTSWWKWLTVFPDVEPDAPDEKQYLCSIFPVEDNCFIAVMGSWGLPMPSNADEFHDAARRFRTPEFARLIDAAEPLGDVHRTGSTLNFWKRFDRLDSPPAGFIAVGDAVSAFNPIYAQGMTSAATQGVILRDVLATNDPTSLEFPKRFFAAQAELLAKPWILAKTRDGGYDHATGTDVMRSAILKKLVAKYTWTGFQFVTEASFDDLAVAEHFDRVFNLHESLPELLRSPRVIGGLARFGLRKMLGRQRVPALVSADVDPPATDYTYRRPPTPTASKDGVDMMGKAPIAGRDGVSL